MNANVIAEEFEALAQQELERGLSAIPADSVNRSVVFIETVRVIDYWSVFQFLLPEERRLSEPDFQILQWGWNLAAGYLLSPFDTPGGFPLIESTHETRLFATTLLHQLGRSTLMRRTAEMIRFGFLLVERVQNGFIVRKADEIATQFLDSVEFSKLESLEGLWRSNTEPHSSPWTFVDMRSLHDVRNRVGSYLLQNKEHPLEKWMQPDIDSLMLPLIHPWDSGHGIMMGYGATPEVDAHFFSHALEAATKWRTEAAIHPTVQLEGITSAHLTVVSAVVISLHAKHIRFALSALKHFPEISIPQSLTIWKPKKEIEGDIIALTGLDDLVAQKAINAITINPKDVSNLRGHTTPFIPLLIDLGNGLVLQPISSIGRNPFHSIRTIQEWRDVNARARIQKPLEDWMRSEIYALFQGTRYSHTSGNIKIRNNNETLTDIDGAIFDRVTGELALFQLKWQDFFTNNVRQLRSKAHNFSEELDEWAEKTEKWVAHVGTSSVMQSLRLKLTKGQSVSAVYLFGVSRIAARMQGFGFGTSHPQLAIANWPQFVRLRCEIGPAAKVFQQMHEALQGEMNATLKLCPLPTTLRIAGKSIEFVDMWNIVET